MSARVGTANLAIWTETVEKTALAEDFPPILAQTLAGLAGTLYISIRPEPHVQWRQNPIMLRETEDPLSGPIAFESWEACATTLCRRFKAMPDFAGACVTARQDRAHTLDPMHFRLCRDFFKRFYLERNWHLFHEVWDKTARKNAVPIRPRLSRPALENAGIPEMIPKKRKQPARRPFGTKRNLKLDYEKLISIIAATELNFDALTERAGWWDKNKLPRTLKAVKEGVRQKYRIVRGLERALKASRWDFVVLERLPPALEQPPAPVPLETSATV